ARRRADAGGGPRPGARGGRVRAERDGGGDEHRLGGHGRPAQLARVDRQPSRLARPRPARRRRRHDRLGVENSDGQGRRDRAGGLHAARLGECALRVSRLKGQAVVVTGGGGGIGRAIARAFAGEGASVIVGDLGDSAEAAAAAIRAEGGRAVAARADVTRAEDMRALAALAEREHGRLDVLVTCAGLGLSGLLATQDEADWLSVIEVNLNGTYRAIRAALPTMMAQGSGRIVTIASVLGKMGGFGYVSACAAVVGRDHRPGAERGRRLREVLVTAVELVALTRGRLAGRERRMVVGGPLVKAAVLVPIVERGGPALVFTKRTDHVGSHRGQ